MAVSVRIGIGFRRLTGGLAVVEAKGSTVGEVIDDLERQFPGLKEGMCDPGGGLRPYVAAFVNGDSVRYRNGIESVVADGDEVTFLPGAAGG